VNSGFRKPFRDPDLIVLREDDSGLLLSVTQSNVMKLDLLGEMKLRANRFIEVPRASRTICPFSTADLT